MPPSYRAVSSLWRFVVGTAREYEPRMTMNDPSSDAAFTSPNAGSFDADAARALTTDPSRNPNTESLAFVLDVPVELTVEIGRRTLKIAEVLRLGPGSVLELEKASGEPLDIYVNNRLVARGEAVVVGERYGVRLTEVFVNDPRGGLTP